jgi:hypothetical protein
MLDIFGLASLGIGALDKIPTGKGKRKATARFLDGEANNLALLMGDLEAAANSGEVISGFALRMLNARLATTLTAMRLTVNAIGPDDIAEDK